MNDSDKKLSPGLEKALQALDTLEEIDLVLVPLQPTQEMISTAIRIADLPAETVTKIYEIMIKVSQE